MRPPPDANQNLFFEERRVISCARTLNAENSSSLYLSLQIRPSAYGKVDRVIYVAFYAYLRMPSNGQSIIMLPGT
jgi:hypothetical protein